MDHKKKLIQCLVSKQHESRKSWNQICKKIGISPSVVSKFLNTSSDISAESLNKLLNYFKVDIYKASRKELKGRVFDSSVTVPVVGVSNNEGVITEPQRGDPKSMLRSNLWTNYNSVLARHDPVYGYQLLYSPKSNIVDKIQAGEDLREIARFSVYAIIEYEQDNKLIKRVTSALYSHTDYLNCSDYPSNLKFKRPLESIKSFYIVEGIFAPKIV